MGAWEDGFAAGWKAGISEGSSPVYRGQDRAKMQRIRPRMPTRRKRTASAYSKRYGAAFKRIAPKNKKKGGGWKQGGFMRTQKAAHRAAKK